MTYKPDAIDIGYFDLMRNKTKNSLALFLAEPW
jgi:hypothetical protein